MTTTITLREMMEEAIEDMNNIDLLYIYNTYCDYTDCSEDRLYFMDDFNEVCEGMKPCDIVLSVQCGNFRTNDRYFLINGYGNFKSFNNVSEVIDTDEIIDFIIDNETTLENKDISSVFYDWEEICEEEEE